MASPLKDELSPEAKAWLAQRFRELGLLHRPMDVERQRWLNNMWHLNVSDRWR